jgi:hypothetical protein
MQTEKRNINCPVSVKTSNAMIYCSVTTNNISRLVMTGFFMSITESDGFEWNAVSGKGIFLAWNKFTSEASELEKRKDMKRK